MTTKRNIHLPESIVFLKSSKLQLLDTAAAAPRTHLSSSLCTTDRSRMGGDLPFRIPVSCALLYILKGMFHRVHPKLTLVRVVATNSGMSTKK